MMSSEDADTLGDVFEIAQRVRLRHQLDQLGRGETPADTIGPKDMSTVEASVLTEAIREILPVQRRMANKADYVPQLNG
jgi:CBS domain-containing protein